jgi:hypothetical protein
MVSPTRRLKTLGKRLLHALFAAGQRVGLNVLPKHFYTQIPDLAEMRGQTAWRAPMSLAGVAGAELEGQIAFAAACLPPDVCTVFRARDVHKEAIAANRSDGGYGQIEAEFLYGFIRCHKPARIIQVGCGVSTAVIELASVDAGYRPRIICVDPYPTELLLSRQATGDIELLTEPAQLVALETLIDLEPGDLLFVDSTHAVKPGSEVNRIVLEVLPRLKAGVFVHFHDIYFPYDYPRRLLTHDLFFHSESTLVHAFLVGNPHCRIEASLSMLHYGARDVMKGWFANYDPELSSDGLAGSTGKHFPSSLWLRTVEPAGR